MNSKGMSAKHVASVAKRTIWHSKHELTHLLMGIFWIKFLSSVNPNVTAQFIPLALFGSLFPDLEHFYFHFVSNRKNPYSMEVKKLLRGRQFTNLMLFLENNHKKESYLPLHHVFVPIVALVVTLCAFMAGMEGVVVFLGSVALHYAFDIVDDIIFLHKLNPNWTRGLNRLV